MTRRQEITNSTDAAHAIHVACRKLSVIKRALDSLMDYDAVDANARDECICAAIDLLEECHDSIDSAATAIDNMPVVELFTA